MNRKFPLPGPGGDAAADLAVLDAAARTAEACLRGRYAVAEGFQVESSRAEKGDEPPATVSYFRPWTFLQSQQQEAVGGGKYTASVFLGATTGLELTLKLDEKSRELELDLAWTSKLQNRLMIGIVWILLAALGVATVGGIAGALEEGALSALLFVFMPWKLLWLLIIVAFVTALPLALLVVLVARLASLFGPKRFTREEIEGCGEEIAALLVR